MLLNVFKGVALADSLWDIAMLSPRRLDLGWWIKLYPGNVRALVTRRSKSLLVNQVSIISTMS